MSLIPAEAEEVRGVVSETDRQVEDLLNGAGGDGQLIIAPQEVPGAFSELQYLMGMARGARRDIKQLLQAARRTGELFGADGLYRFPVGGKNIEGPTIDLMEALAQDYGWIWKGVTIDRVEGKKVFMRGVVVDLINGVMTHRPYVSNMTDASKGFAKNEEGKNRWETMQLQVGFSKAMRTALEHALPHWMIREAVEAAKAASSAEILKDKAGKPISLAQAIEEGLAWLGSKGITKSDVETLFGSQTALWTISDARELRQLIKDLAQGVVTVAGIKAQVASATGQPAPAAPASGLASVAKVAEAAAPARSEALEALTFHADLAGSERAEACLKMEAELSPSAIRDLREKAGVTGMVTSKTVLDKYHRALLAAMPG